MASEDGVWRTISGRRVFIKTGQTLTDAMRESGKFSNLKKMESGRYRVYGKAEGQEYDVVPGDEYTLTGDRAGEKITVPENETGELEVYKAPKTSGFKDGKYVSDENKNAILSNGRVVLNDHDFNNEYVIKVKSMIEAETLRLSGLKKEGEFFRGTDNAEEINYLRDGTIRASKNHMTGEQEDGLSVWESPKYAFKYQYRVSGDVVGIGSDGEPLLDPKSVKLVSDKSYQMSDYNAAMARGKTEFCDTYQWTEEQYDAALKGNIKNKKRL